jgi:hypothetical protein
MYSYLDDDSDDNLCGDPSINTNRQEGSDTNSDADGYSEEVVYSSESDSDIFTIDLDQEDCVSSSSNMQSECNCTGISRGKNKIRSCICPVVDFCAYNSIDPCFNCKYSQTVELISGNPEFHVPSEGDLLCEKLPCIPSIHIFICCNKGLSNHKIETTLPCLEIMAQTKHYLRILIEIHDYIITSQISSFADKDSISKYSNRIGYCNFLHACDYVMVCHVEGEYRTDMEVSLVTSWGGIICLGPSVNNVLTLI